MKTKLVKNIMAPLVAACALVLMVAPTATGQGTEGGRLQGTWEMQITLTDCAGHVIGASRQYKNSSREARPWSRAQGHRRL
jgi:hypothetical protein